MKIAFVAPFFGRRAAGGAEAECRQTALRLAAAGLEVDILTTCLLDLTHDWNVSYYREGVEKEDGLTVRRFRAEPVPTAAMARLNTRLLAGEAVSPDEALRFFSMHINSFGLYRYLARAANTYDRICFIPYLFGTTVFGTRLCADRAILIPCLHDEPYARTPPVADLFRRVRGIVYHTDSERSLAERLYGPEIAAKGQTIGEGVDLDFTSDPDRFRRTYGIREPFVLYAGRKDRTKNVPMLVEAFAQARRHGLGPVKLVLIGPGRVPIPFDLAGDILDLGFVPEQAKRDAYGAAAVFCHPSLNESFSIVLMEAWAAGCPALVHGDSAVLREHVVRAGGGLYFETAGAFEACLRRLLDDPALRAALGHAGRRYAHARFAWPHILARFQNEVLAR